MIKFFTRGVINMTMYLIIAAVVIVACIALNKLSDKIGIPMLLAFILLGMIFGSDGLFRIEFENYEFAEQICSIALIFIMFYGGFGTSWKAAKPVANKAILLSTLGVLLTSLITGLFCHFILNFNLNINGIFQPIPSKRHYFIIRGVRRGIGRLVQFTKMLIKIMNKLGEKEIQFLPDHKKFFSNI